MHDLALPLVIMVATFSVLCGLLLAFRGWLRQRDHALEQHMAALTERLSKEEKTGRDVVEDHDRAAA